MKVSHNTVLITGGTSGIGLSLAGKFLSENNRVIVTGRSQDKLAYVQTRLPGVETRLADMNDPQSIEQLAQNSGDVNILICNAGIQNNYQFADQGIAAQIIEDEMRTNFVGPLSLIKAMLPGLLKQANSAIVTVSSGLGIVPKQSAPVYCASKAAIHSFSRSLRWQLESTNVKVFEIIPPLVDTPMTSGRGSGKISPDELVEEFWGYFRRDVFEMPIGRVKFLLWAQRFAPQLADRIMRGGL